MSNIVLPVHQLRKQILQVQSLIKSPQWSSIPENKQFAQQILERSRELFYKYEPYYNRRDGEPSWQWEFLAAAQNYKGRLALGANRIGKPIAQTETVLMANGLRKLLRDIRVGDKVLSYCLNTGIATPAEVINKFDSGLLDCYKTTFSDGYDVVTAGSHPFPIKMRSGKKCTKVQRKTIEELIPRLDNSTGLRTRMLSPSTVEFEKQKELPIDPYAIGAMLGDGNFKQLKFWSADECVALRVIAGLEEYLEGVSKNEEKQGCIEYRFLVGSSIETNGRYVLSDLKKEFEQLGLLDTNNASKFIPQCYLSASVDDRRQLLAGLIDTDGFKLGFTVKSEVLAVGFQFLVRSLGGKATIQKVEKKCTNTGIVGIYWNVYWRLSDIPCELQYKIPKKTKRQCDYTSRIIREITSIGKCQTYCIEINHPDHCFLISDFVATYNSDQGAYECVLASTGKHPCRKFPAQSSGWIVGLDYNMVRDINLPKFDKFLPRNFAVSSTFNKADKIWWIRGEGKECKIKFMSSDAGRAKFQGDSVDWIWFDEEPLKTDIWPESMRALIDREGIWWMTATPVLGTAWLKALSEQDNVFVTTGTMWDNPYLPWEEIELQAAELSEEEGLVRIEGQYIIFGGSPVFNIRILTKMINGLREDIPISKGFVESYVA